MARTHEDSVQSMKRAGANRHKETGRLQMEKTSSVSFLIHFLALRYISKGRSRNDGEEGRFHRHLSSISLFMLRFYLQILNLSVCADLRRLRQYFSRGEGGGYRHGKLPNQMFNFGIKYRFFVCTLFVLSFSWFLLGPFLRYGPINLILHSEGWKSERDRKEKERVRGRKTKT